MQTELLALGIEFRHSRPYHPQTCGKVERFHQTMKAFLARQPPAGSIAELQAQVDRFVAYYNEVRPHRARKRRPPRVAFEARAKARPRGPMIRVGAGVRVRRDRIDNNGKVTLRQPDPPAITSAWDTPTRAKRVIMLVNGLDVRVVSQDGELLGSSRLIRPGTTSLRDEASTMPRHIRPRCADTSHGVGGGI